MDPNTAYTWTVEAHVCEACRMLEVAHDNEAEGPKVRGRKYTVAQD